MQSQQIAERGFSLIETVMATAVLSVGLLGAAAVLTTGMQRLGTSPNDVIATQKAAEAVESVFSARDSSKITWAQLQNVQGATGSDGGIFLDAPQQLKLAGADGLVNTADDTTIETSTLPGVDQTLGTTDDKTVSLTNYRRQIKIRDVANEPLNCGGGGPDPCTLRSITVTVTYPDGKDTRTYTLTTYISTFS